MPTRTASGSGNRARRRPLEARSIRLLFAQTNLAQKSLGDSSFHMKREDKNDGQEQRQGCKELNQTDCAPVNDNRDYYADRLSMA
jgi:hypothetical protein